MGTPLPAQPEGITNPPIDDLLSVTGSKYELVSIAAKRARQINSYYAQLQEGLLENVGPLVTPGTNEKPLSIALREVNESKIVAREVSEADFLQTAAEPQQPAPVSNDGAIDFSDQ
ncbi:DNA-directed RNA polymerase subunit omega [Brevibacterium renqingii]|uniref:DNA-directed RNA polymerase subunit omega n=1 Tax=Brevibacterium renqingii TaxID=2776916 RepID=UPI001ADFD7DF|nr:DNA-directed RNA polymerase subunit omega [Brevibacterium renqingii]